MKLRHLYISALAFLLAACGSKQDYRNAIPAKSAAVVSIDIKSMSEKSGLSGDNANEKLLSRLENMVKSGLTGSEALVEKVFNDAGESGLGVKDKIYLFAGEQAKMGGLLVKVTDSGKLDNVLDVLKKQQVCAAVKESDGCKWTVLGNWLLAYNDNALVFVADNKGSNPQSLVRQASMWLRQKEG